MQVTVEAGILSLLAILYVVLMIARNVLWRVRHMSAARLRIFHQPMDILIFSLLFADAVQAVGMVLSIIWVRTGKVEVGNFCTVQGVVKIFGATGVALSTLAIALYTFISVWRMKGISSMRTTAMVVACIWSSIAVLAIVALVTNQDPSKPNLIGPVPYWCWVDSHYLEWRILGEYVWMWITMFLSLLVYVSLYMWIRGTIPVGRCMGRFRRFSTMGYPHNPARRRQSLVMLVYPMVYCMIIMPLSVVRWINFVQEARYNRPNYVPAPATFAANGIFGLSGFFNVILLLTTKPESGLFGQLMFVSPARPPSMTSEPSRDESRSGDDEFLKSP